MNPIEAILHLGAIAGLITISLEVHQSRRNRPSLVFTQEGYATVNFRLTNTSIGVMLVSKA